MEGGWKWTSVLALEVVEGWFSSALASPHASHRVEGGWKESVRWWKVVEGGRRRGKAVEGGWKWPRALA